MNTEIIYSNDIVYDVKREKVNYKGFNRAGFIFHRDGFLMLNKNIKNRYNVKDALEDFERANLNIQCKFEEMCVGTIENKDKTSSITFSEYIHPGLEYKFLAGWEFLRVATAFGNLSLATLVENFNIKGIVPIEIFLELIKEKDAFFQFVK